MSGAVPDLEAGRAAPARAESGNTPRFAPKAIGRTRGQGRPTGQFDREPSPQGTGVERLREVLPNFTRRHALTGVCGAPYKCPPAPSECALMLTYTADYLVVALGADYDWDATANHRISPRKWQNTRLSSNEAHPLSRSWN